MIRDVFSLWFGLTRPVDRATYLKHGLALTLLKYVVDAALVFAATGTRWTPLDYANPLFLGRQHAMGNAPTWLLAALVAWALPFLWIGLSMSLRRCLDARVSPWFALLFFTPLLNWAFLLVMSALPSRPQPSPPPNGPPAAQLAWVRSALTASLVGAISGLAITAMITFGLKNYGMALFVGMPIGTCAVAGYLFNRPLVRSPRATATLGAFTVLLLAGSLLIFAAEGAICIGMVLPLALPLGAAGAIVGRHLAIQAIPMKPAALLLLLLPFSAWAEVRVHAPVPLREVLTTVDVAAPPERVWPNVLQFGELPAPSPFIEHSGIAYPQRAHLEGQGVGAVRYCEFSTGPFIEPITAWEPPTRLAFDVRAQPPPMKEWSPYADLHPPHFDGTLESKRGEFHLIALPNGHTRLEGRTWYTLDMGPSAYWTVFTDLAIHRIHVRVLEQVKALSER